MIRLIKKNKHYCQQVKIILGGLLVLCFLSVISGCTHKALVDVEVQEKQSRAPSTGGHIRDARNNQYWFMAPDKWRLEQQGDSPLSLPLVLETYCGNQYYQLVIIDNWALLTEPDMKAINPVLFEIDENKELCR